MGSSAALIVVYVLLVLFLLASVAYGYYAWRNYRQAMDEALQRRRARDLERGDRLTTDDYWIRDAAAATERDREEASRQHHQHQQHSHPVAVPVYSPSLKATTQANATTTATTSL